MAEVLTKSQFARLIQRDPAFVTRAILSGKLHGEALVGEGRSARINADVARRQLLIGLDLGQQLAQAAPILPEAGGLFDRPADPGEAAAPTVEEAERREHLRQRNEKLRDEIARQRRIDREREGELLERAAVGVAIRRQLTPLVSVFDELPQAIAKPLAEQFGLNYAELLIAVKQAMRNQRQTYAAAARALAVEANIAEIAA